jgi:hypothetical protein
MEKCQSREVCADCGKDLRRVFAAPKAQVFESFYDPTYECHITSAKQESRLMKEHGHINANDAPFKKKYKEQIKKARWKAGKTKSYAV